MGRPATHRVVKHHPSPRFRDVVKLHNFVRGPLDEGWHAQFLMGGAWTPRNPVALGTKDWDEACERARDKYTLAQSGQPITTPRPVAIENPFSRFAERAVASLTQQATDADKIAIGKGHTFRDIARRITVDLVPKWGDTSITKLTEYDLDDWIRNEYRVVDKAASKAEFGSQSAKEPRHAIYKKPAATTLGNLDRALKYVWDEAVDARVVDRRVRPYINRAKHGEPGEPRAFIDDEGMKAVAKVMMADGWLSEGRTEEGYKRMLRCYIAVAAATGIRPGLELKRVKIGNIQFQVQNAVPVMTIFVERKAGKHFRARPVPIYEGGVLPVRRLLTEMIEARKTEGATDQDLLFQWKGNTPVFRSGLQKVLEQASAVTDPMTGERRVAYSFRHYFATVLIQKGLSVAHIAEWLGTSSAMVERHYNRFLVQRNAYLYTDYADRPPTFIDELSGDPIFRFSTQTTI
jgi:integrase